MLSNIKAYQSKTASLSQNSISCCAPGCLLTKTSLLILTSCCHVCLHSQDALALLTGWFGGPSKPFKRIKKRAVSWVWLVFSAY